MVNWELDKRLRAVAGRDWPQPVHFTQEDPIGLAGGMNLYGYADGDPINNYDPFGLDVQYRGDGDGSVAEKAWNDLKGAAKRARRSKDKGVKKAAKDLLDMMRKMEDDPRTTYVVAFSPMSDAAYANTGGGQEVCGAGSSECWITIASQGPLSGHLTALAHEAGGAFGTRRGLDHYGMIGGVKWENAARRVFGCSLRSNHAESPTACK